MSKTLRGKFRMPDRDFLEILDAPKIAVHADGPEIKRGDAERLRSDFAVPAIEPPEIQIRRTIGQTSGFDGMGIIDQKQEHVAVAGVKGGRVLGHVHERIVVMVDQSSTPGTFHRVSPMPLPAIFITAATSS